MKTIIVNATALDFSGALTILRQFIEAIPMDKNIEYIVFISPIIELHTDNSNVRLVQISGVKSFIGRFLWDAFGVRRWLRKNNVIPSITISLQNTNFRVGYKIPNYIYYHQSIPFYNHSWSLSKPQERSLWFYKHIYPFFVQLFLNSRTQVFVQLEFIKEGFVKKFGFNSDKIYVIRPKISVDIKAVNDDQQMNLDQEKINIFYPATPFFYKNHKVLLDALFQLKNDNFALYFTCKHSQLDYDIPQNINFMGAVTFNKVMSMYKVCDAVVFPSYIETFGLPLIEAASAGCVIIAADLPYSREVLKGYDGAVFVAYDKSEEWANAIGSLEKSVKHHPLSLDNHKSWKELFDILIKN